MKLKSLGILILTSTILIGCSKQENNTNQETVEPSVQESVSEKEINDIFNFEIPDYCFNEKVSKDDKGNYYFIIGADLYKKDKNNKTTKLMSKFPQNKYLISYIYYYKDNLYALTHAIKNNKPQKYSPIIKIDLNTHKITEIVDTSEHGYLGGSFIYDDHIYTVHQTYDHYNGYTTVKFPLHNPSQPEIINESILEKRHNFFKNFTEDLKENIKDYIREDITNGYIEEVPCYVDHADKPFLYFIEDIRTKRENRYKDKYIIQYNTDTQEIKHYCIGIERNVRRCNYIDGYFYIWNQDGFFQLDKNFDKKTLLIPSNKIKNEYVFGDGRIRKRKIEWEKPSYSKTDE